MECNVHGSSMAFVNNIYSVVYPVGSVVVVTGILLTENIKKIIKKKQKQFCYDGGQTLSQNYGEWLFSNIAIRIWLNMIECNALIRVQGMRMSFSLLGRM